MAPPRLMLVCISSAESSSCGPGCVLCTRGGSASPHGCEWALSLCMVFRVLKCTEMCMSENPRFSEEKREMGGGGLLTSQGLHFIPVFHCRGHVQVGSEFVQLTREEQGFGEPLDSCPLIVSPRGEGSGSLAHPTTGWCDLGCVGLSRGSQESISQ